MVKLEKISSNFHRLYIGEAVIWFSYEAIIGFSLPSVGTIISTNVWSTTTGKHLNMISRTLPRVKNEEFNRLVAEHLDQLGKPEEIKK
jgi:hypothetical protein